MKRSVRGGRAGQVHDAAFDHGLWAQVTAEVVEAIGARQGGAV